MKLGVTTLGCWEWDLATIISNLKKYGYHGVDFRGYKGNVKIYELPEFSSQLEQTKRLIQESGLEVPCLSSSIRACIDPDGGQAELEQYARLCSCLGAKYIRIFGGKPRDMDLSEAKKHILKPLRKLCQIAEQYNVWIIFETHDAWMASDDLAEVINQVDHPRLGVLWDVHHPYRFKGESLEYTWARLGHKIWYTHIKDSKSDPSNPEDVILCLPGEGDIPIKEVYQLLKEKGYQGYFTLEWERPWRPYLPPPEIAFPKFIELVKSFEGDSR